MDNYIELDLLMLVETEYKSFSKEIMRNQQKIKNIAWDILAGSYLWKYFRNW